MRTSLLLASGFLAATIVSGPGEAEELWPKAMVEFGAVCASALQEAELDKVVGTGADEEIRERMQTAVVLWDEYKRPRENSPLPSYSTELTTNGFRISLNK